MSSVDVIVPCYRYGRFLRQCVESVLAQSGPAVRVLILDDESPDDTPEVATELAREDSRVVSIRHVRNKGHIATYNEGLDWASADYLLLLSADDYLLPGALARSASLMDAHPEVGFTFGDAISLTGDEAVPRQDPAREGWQILRGLDFIELSGPENIVATSTAVVRTKLQKHVGGYRAELPHSGDMEMWLRLAACSSVGRVRARQAVYRQHDENMSRGYMAQCWMPDLQQRLEAYQWFFRTCGNAMADSERLRRRLYRSLGCCAIGFASMAFNEGDLETSARLSDFALAICSSTKLSLPWMKLECKRRLGFNGWRLLAPVFSRKRRTAAPD
jgi:glycosyltransferase involved in cell wall biosynthesis